MTTTTKGTRVHVSRNSDTTVTRLSQKAREKLDQLGELLDRQEQNVWAIGDCLIPLVDSHRIPLKVIAKHTGFSRSRLCEWRLTAKVFAPSQRDGFSFQDCLLARLISERFKTLNTSLLEVRDEIKRLRITRIADAKNHFIQRMLSQQRNEAVIRGVAAESRAGQLINAPHHADYQEVVSKLPNGSVKLFVADPPFGGYSWRPHGGYASGRSDTSGFRYDCDNNATEDAMKVTLDLFRVCRSKITEGGCLLLFQPGGKPDRPEILAAATEHGWQCQHVLTWHKTNMVNPGHLADPYGVSTERILLFCRIGDRIQWHERDLSRSDVLTFETETKTAHHEMQRGERNFGDMFVYQKPIPLLELLVRKHSFQGELVVEPFGGSGSAVIAAAQLGRRWVYCESNAATYAWAAPRIERMLADHATAAG